LFGARFCDPDVPLQPTFFYVANSSIKRSRPAGSNPGSAPHRCTRL
jgi:hypothetical protein